MSIYHKIVELSIPLEIQKKFFAVAGCLKKERVFRFITRLIAIAFSSSLMANIVYPPVAIASNTGAENRLNFSVFDSTPLFSYNRVADNIFSLETISADIVQYGNRKILMLPVTPVIETDNDKIAEKICAEAGITDLPCWQDLRAMREKESYNGKAMTGDSGRSRGWYHIQIKLHGITDECALDFECSTAWTVKNLIANGYKINRSYAISRHNGSGKMAQMYARSVVYNSAKFDK